MATKTRKRSIGVPIRMSVTAILILVQIAIVIYLVYFVSGKAIWIYSAFNAISLLMVAYIINRKGNPSYKLTWVIFILGLPPIGGVVFLIWGGGRVLPKVRKRMAAIRRSSRQYLEQDPLIFNKLLYADAHHSRQAKYLLGESDYPVYTNTDCEYLSPGEKFFPRMLEELESANHYIFMEFFILSEGKMWDKIHEVLLKKIAQGVEVRVIFDDFGSITRQYRGFAQNLRNEGIKVAIFNPIKPSVDLFLNNRNHRKIVVIDGKVSMTGGINIGDEYINEVTRFGYWMDCAAIFKGSATKSFVVMFCDMWNCINKTDIISPKDYIVRVFPECEGFVQPYSDDPLNDRNPAEGLYMQMLGTAQKYVYIVSPYLVIDNTMAKILVNASQSGVAVSIVTPAKWDKWYVHPVTQYYYEELLEAGVKIFEFTPGFIHSKLFVSDDRVATIGTVNMDYRSFYFHFECGVWMCNNRAVYDIKNHITRIIEDCKEIKLSEWKKRPVMLKAKQSILHLLAPFM